MVGHLLGGAGAIGAFVAVKTLQDKNKAVADYSGLYIPGQNWYALLSMIWYVSF